LEVVVAGAVVTAGTVFDGGVVFGAIDVAGAEVVATGAVVAGETVVVAAVPQPARTRTVNRRRHPITRKTDFFIVIHLNYYTYTNSFAF